MIFIFLSFLDIYVFWRENNNLNPYCRYDLKKNSKIIILHDNNVINIKMFVKYSKVLKITILIHNIL